VTCAPATIRIEADEGPASVGTAMNWSSLAAPGQGPSASIAEGMPSSSVSAAAVSTVAQVENADVRPLASVNVSV
jgi:hypothetical protein